MCSHDHPRPQLTKVPIPVGLSNVISRAFPFQPDIGPWSIHLNRVIAAIVRADPITAIEDALTDISQALQASPRPTTARYAFALALLADVIQAGGRAYVRDSKLW